MVLSNRLGATFQGYSGSSVHIQSDENLEQHPQALVKMHSCTTRIAAAVACLHKWAGCGAGSLQWVPLAPRPQVTASPARPRWIPRDTFKPTPCYQISPSANPSVHLVSTLIKGLKTPPCPSARQAEDTPLLELKVFSADWLKREGEQREEVPCRRVSSHCFGFSFDKSICDYIRGRKRNINAHRI